MIKYLNGDATKPDVPGNKIIVHVCNNKGGWGKGFVTAISKRWSLPEQKYREWFNNSCNFGLGKTQFVKVEDDIFVANMVAQNGYRSAKNLVPLQYDALESCLNTVALFAIENKASIHMPRIGCNLAGGSWINVLHIINKTIDSKGFDIYVYDYFTSKACPTLRTK